MISAIPQWAQISLVDPATGRQVLNTLAPLGSELPASSRPDVIRAVAERREPTIRTHYAGEGGILNENAILIYMPVVRNDRVPFVLVAAVRAELIQRLLPQRSDDDVLSAIVDERGRVLVRSRELDQLAGFSVGEQIRRAAEGQASGLFEAVAADGQKVYTGFQRSLLTGWIAVAATDHRRFDSANEQSTWTLIGTGALSLTLAAVLAVFLFYNVVERRVSGERLAASRALGELDARLLATTQEALSEQRKSASEREVLLREIYHRVKNNLQIIQSLLRLGSRNLSQSQQEPFESAIRRIGAMAGVHSLLYKSPDLASIDFKDYLEDVVRETALGFGADMRGIRTELDAQSMRIPLDTAVPLAFITVELLTNAFKHAFPADRQGCISVSAKPEGDHGVLMISDDGVGFNETRQERRPLGLTLVNKLVEQIGGTLEGPQLGGSTYRVRFPLVPIHQPPPFAPSGTNGDPSDAGA
jgi:two-component sensor histidine kinase